MNMPRQSPKSEAFGSYVKDDRARLSGSLLALTRRSAAGQQTRTNLSNDRASLAAQSLHPALRRLPDVFVHLELKPDFEIVLQNPIDQLARVELIENS